MGKRKKDKRRRNRSQADPRRDDLDESRSRPDGGGDDGENSFLPDSEPEPEESGSSERGVVAAAGGGLPIYKPGQGYYTRMGTVFGGGTLILMGCFWLHAQLGVWRNESWGLYVQNGAALALFAGSAWLLYWVCGKKQRTCDFMIATEGEMKKVNWSSKREIIGSTKVVIGAVLLLSVMLFVIDFLFRWFFKKIDVLRI
jgi:preprotein translocase SecE subunit